MNKVISNNQMGTRRMCQGAKEQALINKVLNQSNGYNLKTSWIDIRKAYDSVHHKYLEDCINKLNMPNNIQNFIRRTLNNQNVNLILNGEEIGKVKVERGILQGDALSPKLFVIAMEPLSRVLNKNCEMISIEGRGELERNHLIFIDDIKLLSANENNLEQLCLYTRDCLDMMGFKINQQKSASNIESEIVFGNMIDEAGYKYMGFLEDARNVIKTENKKIINNRIEDRTKKLCQTRLNARYLFQAVNEFALSTMNFYTGIVPYEQEELYSLDLKIRNIMEENKVIRKASNIDRLYLPRDGYGRGLQSVVEKAEQMILTFHDYLENKLETRPLIEYEKKEVTHLGLIKEYLKNKYQLEMVTIMNVKIEQRKKRMDHIMSKSLHSRLFMSEESPIDTIQSSMWLKYGNISPQEEGRLCKLQDRNLFFGHDSIQGLCQRCRKHNKSVEHLATGCGAMIGYDYKKRHNAVVRCIHFLMTKRYGLNKNKKLHGYKVESIVANNRVKIKSDITIKTRNPIEANKPDLMIHDIEQKHITLIEVGITNKSRIGQTEAEKIHKYRDLEGELAMMYPDTTIITIPVVMTWDGITTRYYKKYMEKIGIDKRLQAYMQYVTLKKTLESILIEFRNINSGAELDEEELEAMMASAE